VFGGIPNEMADAQRWKFLACIPGRQSADRAGAFVLPDFFPNRRFFFLFSLLFSS
jgi:hypothetical protein